MADIFEYRGVSDLVYAEVTKDDSTGYTTGTVKSLAGVAEISKATNTSSETHYYDNLPAIVVQSMTSDEITINASAIPLEVLAELKGQTYDAETGTYIEAEGVQKTWAIGYKTQNTKGEVLLHIFAKFKVKRRKRLVKKQYLRLVCNGARYRNALLLAA